MSNQENFNQIISNGYTFKNDSIILGGAVLNDKPVTNLFIKAPLKTFNRHGLIAGATGTGKTKTMQNIAERLSEKGVPVLIMDVKGDISGLAQPSNGHAKIDERHESIGTPWKASGYPIEFLSISDEPGVKMRATISEFGPVLLSKILNLNDNQEGLISLVFKYCDDNNLPLLDIKDLRSALQYISKDVKDEVEKKYGLVSRLSIGSIMRKLLDVEQQGAEKFFGEISFEVEDLCRTDKNGRGFINILRITDIQGKPKLFSTFMLCLMAEVFAKFPEQGDADKPELVIFIDEAHLIFKESTDALLDQLETVVKLIRSKGVGIFFVTQNPVDIPESILSQLGMKIQHALRAFTAKDRKAIKLAAENYPLTEFYDVDELLTKLGIGEAIITVLNEKGIPTPLTHTLLTAPSSRMDILTKNEIDDVIKKSKLIKEYNKEVDRESAYEILMEKMEDNEEKKPKKRSSRREKSTFEKIASSSVGRTIARELTRTLLGVLGLKSTRRRRR